MLSCMYNLTRRFYSDGPKCFLLMSVTFGRDLRIEALPWDDFFPLKKKPEPSSGIDSATLWIRGKHASYYISDGPDNNVIKYSNENYIDGFVCIYTNGRTLIHPREGTERSMCIFGWSMPSWHAHESKCRRPCPTSDIALCSADENPRQPWAWPSPRLSSNHLGPLTSLCSFWFYSSRTISTHPLGIWHQINCGL